MENYKFLLQDLTKIRGIGKKTAEILKKKKINNLVDLIFKLPQSFTDRTKTFKINELQIGKISTIKIVVKKYSFPRIRLIVSMTSWTLIVESPFTSPNKLAEHSILVRY